MKNVVSSTGRFSRSLVYVALVIAVLVQLPAKAQQHHGDEAMLTYLRGQNVTPVFHGWEQNPDGSYTLHFSYINRNWQEEVDIPIGPDNNISPAPYGPDGGQPTHFYPRQNRWVFTIQVPKDFGDKEIVWTLTSHGETNRAYASLKGGYAVDYALIEHEFGTGPEAPDKPRPSLEIQGSGAKVRTAKVGEAVQLQTVAIDPYVPPAGRGRRAAPAANSDAAVAAANAAAAGDFRTKPGQIGPGQVGGDFIRATGRGLWFAWLVYRGNSANVKIDPKIPFKVWEDERGGSPWSPDFKAPPIPPGNKWTYNVTFSAPGTYVLRAVAHTGNTFKYENITFNVTQ
jgi:hypothetical protein